MSKGKKNAAKNAAKKIEKKIEQKISSSSSTAAGLIPSVPRQLPLKPLKVAQAAAKKAAKKAQASDEVFIQFADKEISHKDVLQRVREEYKNSGTNDIITSLKAYVKPEEGKIYYVINKEITGCIDY